MECMEEREREMYGAETDGGGGEGDEAPFALIARRREGELGSDEVDDGVDLFGILRILGVSNQLLELEGSHFALLVELVAQIAHNVGAERWGLHHRLRTIEFLAHCQQEWQQPIQKINTRAMRDE